MPSMHSRNAGTKPPSDNSPFHAVDAEPSPRVDNRYLTPLTLAGGHAVSQVNADNDLVNSTIGRGEGHEHVVRCPPGVSEEDGGAALDRQTLRHHALVGYEQPGSARSIQVAVQHPSRRIATGDFRDTAANEAVAKAAPLVQDFDNGDGRQQGNGVFRPKVVPVRDTRPRPRPQFLPQVQQPGTGWSEVQRRNLLPPFVFNRMSQCFRPTRNFRPSGPTFSTCSHPASMTTMSPGP